jgi:hypothetical protein
MLGGSHAFNTETGKPGRFAPKLPCYYLLRFKEESGNIHFSLLSQVGSRTFFETFRALLKGYLGTKQTEKSLQDTSFQFLM